MEGIDYDEIRKAVAIRHGFVLGKEDPVLVTVTINELVLSHFLKLASERYSAANQELTVALQQQVAQAKDTAGRVITDATDYVAKEVHRAVSVAITDAVATAVRDAGTQLRQQLLDAQSAASQADTSSRAVVAARNGIMVAAIASGIAAVIALVALLAVVVKLR